MKSNILSYLEDRLKELEIIMYDTESAERQKTMAKGAWAETKMIYSFVKKLED